MRPSITHLTSDGAVFDNGHFEEYDTIVQATGYDYKFPFLDDKVRNIGFTQQIEHDAKWCRLNNYSNCDRVL